MKVKPYIPEYDLQGEDYEVPDNVGTKEDWERFKQLTIDDFIKKFAVIFRNKYKGEWSSFGQGFYKDNKKNRQLNRVGQAYDKGLSLRSQLGEYLRSRRISIAGESTVLGRLKEVGIEIPEKRPWTQQELLYLDRMVERGIPVPFIAERLIRTPSAVYSKASKLKRQPI